MTLPRSSGSSMSGEYPIYQIGTLSWHRIPPAMRDIAAFIPVVSLFVVLALKHKEVRRSDGTIWRSSV